MQKGGLSGLIANPDCCFYRGRNRLWNSNRQLYCHGPPDTKDKAGERSAKRQQQQKGLNSFGAKTRACPKVCSGIFAFSMKHAVPKQKSKLIFIIKMSNKIRKASIMLSFLSPMPL
jgi:hypothetical protein